MAKFVGENNLEVDNKQNLRLGETSSEKSLFEKFTLENQKNVMLKRNKKEERTEGKEENRKRAEKKEGRKVKIERRKGGKQRKQRKRKGRHSGSIAERGKGGKKEKRKEGNVEE